MLQNSFRRPNRNSLPAAQRPLPPRSQPRQPPLCFLFLRVYCRCLMEMASKGICPFVSPRLIDAVVCGQKELSRF